MTEEVLLIVEGEVDNPLRLTYEHLLQLHESLQIRDVSQIEPSRRGKAVTLDGLLDLAQLRPGVRYLGLHSGLDDFHASVPLAAVRQQAFLIYQQDGVPLAESAGGPVRFYIPNPGACRSAEIDECANVKHVDRIELTFDKGFDNRPEDEQQHQQLHGRQESP